MISDFDFCRTLACEAPIRDLRRQSRSDPVLDAGAERIFGSREAEIGKLLDITIPEAARERRWLGLREATQSGRTAALPATRSRYGHYEARYISLCRVLDASGVRIRIG